MNEVANVDHNGDNHLRLSLVKLRLTVKLNQLQFMKSTSVIMFSQNFQGNQGER